MKNAVRLDVAVAAELGISRERAAALIMAGEVYLGGQKATKAGQPVPEGAAIDIRGGDIPFVSRGGLKLQRAIEVFSLDLAGKICIDVGASTGGFTDCMLQRGAAKVYAVDVGYGQLAWKLREDPRVINLERTNIRFVTGEYIPEKIDFASADVSFISLKLVLPVVQNLLAPGAQIAALIKPQFEVGRESVGDGVIRDAALHRGAVDGIAAFARSIGLFPAGITHSPVKGPKGNIEFLLLCETGETERAVTAADIDDAVDTAHRALNG